MRSALLVNCKTVFRKPRNHSTVKLVSYNVKKNNGGLLCIFAFRDEVKSMFDGFLIGRIVFGANMESAKHKVLEKLS
jgi:hypothetical protein